MNKNHFTLYHYTFEILNYKLLVHINVVIHAL